MFLFKIVMFGFCLLGFAADILIYSTAKVKSPLSLELGGFAVLMTLPGFISALHALSRGRRA
jgi:hypothetical protein